MTAQQHAQRVADFFERFGPPDLPGLGDWYHDDAAFKDPFNDVRGLEAIRQVYAHMFQTLKDPRFTVWRCTAAERECWLAWRFSFGTDAGTTVVEGASHLQFAPDGRIASHRDYWDPAEELYEKVPVLGWVMRTIRRRLGAPQKA
jgi:steroid delta-isomerase